MKTHLHRNGQNYYQPPGDRELGNIVNTIFWLTCDFLNSFHDGALKVVNERKSS